MDVESLRRQLAHVTDLHERAERQLGELLGMPDRTAELRAKIGNPDIGVPLLARYDAALAEKETTIAQLQSEVTVLRGQLEARDFAGREAGIAARTAEQRATLELDATAATRGATEAVVQQLRRSVVELQAELAAARDRVSAAMIADGHARDEIRRLSDALDSQVAAVRAANDARAEAVNEADALRRRLAAVSSSDDEAKATVEGVKIQLHLAARENDDKAQEMERLRGKMSQALKQASDNHVTHLRLVEEKHRSVVEAQREELRAQEAVVVKLRAQLARADWLHGAAKSQDSAMTLADGHTRVAQEAEIKRLYAEVAALTAQRDEATFRLEAAAATKRGENDERMRELRRDTEQLKARVRELEERLAAATAAHARSSDEARVARDELRAATAERQRLANERRELERAAEAARRAQVAAEERAELAANDSKAQVEAERRVARALERRLNDTRSEDQHARDRLAAECDDWRRQFEAAAAAQREAGQRLAEVRAALAEKDKAAETLGVRCERLAMGLQSHKTRLVALDTKLAHAATREAQLLEQCGSVALACEEARLDAATAQRERDRAERELAVLAQQLDMIARASAGKAATAAAREPRVAASASSAAPYLQTVSHRASYLDELAPRSRPRHQHHHHGDRRHVDETEERAARRREKRRLREEQEAAAAAAGAVATPPDAGDDADGAAADRPPDGRYETEEERINAILGQ
jgi:chromosome segregation ATPase